MITRLFASAGLALCLFNPAIAATSAKEAVVTYFTHGDLTPSVERKANVVSVEVCLDLCDFYQANRLGRESDLWDLIFIHQYYWSEDSLLDGFREKYGAIASQLLAVHARGCAVEAEKDQAKCAIFRLQKQLGASYWFVRYDEGYRCQVAKRFTNPQYQGKGWCTSARK